MTHSRRYCMPVPVAAGRRGRYASSLLSLAVNDDGSVHLRMEGARVGIRSRSGRNPGKCAALGEDPRGERTAVRGDVVQIAVHIRPGDTLPYPYPNRIRLVKSIRELPVTVRHDRWVSHGIEGGRRRGGATARLPACPAPQPVAPLAPGFSYAPPCFHEATRILTVICRYDVPLGR